jgi:1-deoxy-D-xylulose-5-phosphate reductoisomerase
MVKKRNIAVIGASGSVGGAVLDVCSRQSDVFRVWALAGNRNVEKILSLGRYFNTEFLALFDAAASERLKIESEGRFSCHGGINGLLSLVDDPRCEEIVFASSGTETLPVLVRALQTGKRVYLANKEIIVAAGEWIMPLAGDRIIPLDSEHNAVWQCLRGEKSNSVNNVYLTASGGPFLDTPAEELKTVSFKSARCHPVWPMGMKISIDSATLMNKGIEMIEARHLFSLPNEKIHALIHPQALVHGFVEFIDGSVKMLFSRPDMRLAVLSALGFPERIENRSLELAPPYLGGLSL